MRLYTEPEARALLPEVVPVVERLRDAFVALRALQSSIEAEARGASGDGSLLANPWDQQARENRAESLNRQLREAAAVLSDHGIELKDPERGLIDFHSEREGKVVYLCYLLGEPDLLYWHDLDAGFAGRQPL
ncbi:MAG: DUF2203 domain-containing protein [Tepidiformaceae bacterium]